MQKSFENAKNLPFSVVRLITARNCQLSFLVDGKRSEWFECGDGDVDRRVISVNGVRNIIVPELHSGQVDVELSYFAVEPLPEVVHDTQIANFPRHLEF